MKAANHLREANDHLTEEGIALYVDALLLGRQAELPRWIRAHVRGCFECKKQITALYVLLAEENYSDVTSHPFLDAHTNAPQLWLRIAAVFVLALGLGIAAYLLAWNPRSPEPPTATVTQEHAPRPADSSEIPARLSKATTANARPSAAFLANLEMENLVGAQLRSAGIKVKSPMPGTTVHGEVVFDWSGETTGPFLLEVWNNRKELQRSLSSGKPPARLHGSLPPGLYYWKLVVGDELQYVGKFVVR